MYICGWWWWYCYVGCCVHMWVVAVVLLCRVLCTYVGGGGIVM